MSMVILDGERLEKKTYHCYDPGSTVLLVVAETKGSHRDLYIYFSILLF